MMTLVVSTNQLKSPIVLPLGPNIIVSSLRKRNLPVKFLDLCFSDSPADDLRSEIEATKPEIVAFSIRNVDNVIMVNQQFYLDDAKQFIAIAKKAGCIVIIGGAAIGSLKEKAFYYLEPDYAIVGEGEAAFPKLIEALAKGSRTDGIPGVTGYNNGVIASEAWEPIADLANIPLPDYSLYDNRYFTYSKTTPMGTIRLKVGVQTKRGCPFNCIYCNYPQIEGENIRFREPEAIVSEMRMAIEKQDDVEFEIADSIFNYPPDFAEAICDRIIGSGISAKWSATCSPAYMTRSLLDKMILAGCTRVEFGIDAACDKMIVSLRKAFSVSDIVDAAGLCRERAQPFMYYLLFGGPQEDRDTIRTTLDVVEEMEPTNLFMMMGLRIYPDTELESIARSENVLSGNLIKPEFYLSSAMDENVWTDIDNYISRHKNSVIQMFSRENCIDFFARRIKISPPVPSRATKKG